MKNYLDNEPFKNKIDQKTLANLLETLDHIKPVFVSRREYKKKNWEILVKTWEDKYWEFFDLYLPKDLTIWEQISIIDYLNQQFYLEKYSKTEELISKIKVLIWIITKIKWNNSQKYLELLGKKYKLSLDFIERIKNHKLKWTPEIKEFIKKIQPKILSRKLWSRKEDFESWTSELAKLISEEFDLTFFRKWINMIRLGLETVNQSEIKALDEKTRKWEKISIRVNFNELDKKEILLRDKIWIDILKKELDEIRQNWNQELITQKEIEASNAIIKALYEYPYQLTNEENWYKINNILKTKEIYCVWFSIIWHAFLTELWIKHNCWLELWHIALELNIWTNKYYFDATWNNKIIQLEYSEKKQDIVAIRNIIIGDVEKYLLASIYYNETKKLTNNGDYEIAIKSGKKVLELTPAETWIYNNLWIALFLKWEQKEWLKLLRKAQKISPNESIIHANLWNYLSLAWENKEANEVLNVAIKLNPTIPNNYLIKYFILSKLWYKKSSSLYVFAGVLINWVENLDIMPYEEEKNMIKILIAQQDFEWLRKYLLSLEESEKK